MIALVLSFVDFLYSTFVVKGRSIVDDDDVAIFDLPRDAFNGVTLDTAIDADAMDDATFRAKLAKSLEIWRDTEVCAVTIYVRLPHSSFVPICTSLGFQFHHARPEYVFMLKWLPAHRPSKFPEFANTMVGVGGLVVNEHEEILVVQERYLRTPHWKLPGGLSDPGENIPATAIREVMEETGVATEFVCILAFRHMHGYHFGCSDFYFVCLLRPVRRGLDNADIVREESEIAQCRWMPIDEYVSSPLVSSANSFIAERYLMLRAGINPPPLPQIPNGLEALEPVAPMEAPPQQPHLNSDIPLYENHLQLLDEQDDNPNPLLNHHQPNRHHQPDEHQPPQPPEENLGYAIVQTPVPNYDGTSMNMCYSVDRIDLNQF